MIARYLLPTLIALMFIAGCAKQSSPTGGPKDTIPPKLISSDPRHEAINFSGKTIDLSFTEYVNVNNPKEQLIVTPSIGKDYKITAKRNVILIALDKDLEKNTTYSLNFREAVQDITEKNSAKNLLIAFSTGSYLDSLSISGKVTDLIKTTDSKEVTVAIHEENDTINILKHRAVYFTKSNDKGFFKIDYLKPAKYKLYAFEDKNKNLVVDSRNESFAFIAKTIDLKKDTSKIDLKLTRLDLRPLKLTSARPYNTYFNIKTSKNTTSYNITSPDSLDLIYGFGEDQSSIKLYNPKAERDSIQIQFSAIDSAGNKLDTILYAKFRTDEVEKEKFSSSIQSSTIIAAKGDISIKYNFNKPIAEFNLDSIYFQKDSLTRINFTKEEVNWLPQQKIFTINKKVPKATFFIDPEQPREKKPDDPKSILKPINKLYTGKGAFISIEGDSSRAVEQNIKPQQIGDLSEIIYNIKSNTTNLIIQLLSKEFKVVAEQFNKKTGKFEDLPAGDYIFRVIKDDNANKKWDLGNYLLNQEPEKIYYSKNDKGSVTITLKANWENELPVLLISD